MTKLAEITHLVIDMDGVLYIENQPMPCLQEFFAFLRRRPIGFRLATNNPTMTPAQFAARLARMGVEVAPGEILTSCTATAAYLAQEYPRGTRMYVFGEDSLHEAMLEQGFVVADQDVAAVVVSMDRQITYEKLKRASLLIRAGARFIATNLDPTTPRQEGLIPAAGAFVAAVEVGCGVKPIAIGKPEPTMYRLAMAQMGARPETTAALGDRLDTDILGGERAGMTTILVLSGISSRAEGEAWGPDYIFADIAELLATWSQNR